MTASAFFLKFLPFLIILHFLKGFLFFLFYFQPLDLFLSTTLALLPFLQFNLWSLLSLGILSLIKGLESDLSSLVWLSYYFFLFWGFLKGQSFFKSETSFFKYSFWSLSLLFFMIIRVWVFFNNLELFSLSYIFIFKLIFKTSLYFLTTFLGVIIFYSLFQKIFSYN